MDKIWSIPQRGEAYTEEELIAYLRSLPKGIVILDGPSLCGKTRLLRRLELESPGTVNRVNHEFIIPYLLKYIRDPEETLGSDLACRIFCMEDADFLAGKPTVQETSARMLCNLGQACLVIVSGICLDDRVPQLISALDSPLRIQFCGELPR